MPAAHSRRPRPSRATASRVATYATLGLTAIAPPIAGRLGAQPYAAPRARSVPGAASAYASASAPARAGYAVAPAYTSADTTPDERRAADQDERARRRAERARQRDSVERADTGSAADWGRLIGRAVREGMRNAAEGARAAAEGARAAADALEGIDVGRDYDPDPRDLRGPTRLDTIVSVRPGAAVDLSLVSGPVTVTAWERPEVRVRGESDRLPFRFERAEGPSGGTVRVYTVRARGRSAGDQRLDVVVPVGTRLTVNSTSGDVRVRGVRGEVDAETVSGDVDVREARRASLSTVSGTVRAAALEGDVRAKSISGDVRLEGARGDADVSSVSGSVDVRGAQLARLRAQTVSGDVSYDGTLARDGRYDLGTQSGEVRLVLPPDAGAALSVQTFSGTIDTSIPLTLQPSSRGSDGAPLRNARRLEFTIGGGGARVTAHSFSGTIVISRASTSRP